MSASERIAPAAAAGTPLRVGFVALGGLGGSGRVACDVARSMAARGHATFALTSAHAPWRHQLGPDVPHVIVDAPVEPTSPDQVAIDTLADQIAAAVRAHDLPVLSVHYGRGLAAAAVGARRRLGSAGPRICVTLHGSDVTALATEPRQAAALAEDLAACDEITAVSSWLADAAVRILRLPRRPRVIHNGVDLELFHPAVREPSAEARLLHASNFRVIKRPRDAIAVLACLRARGLAARLTMAGDGPLREDAIAMARRLGLSDHVEFPGAVAPEGLAERLRASDVVLVTSASESFGLVALEAMASGVPVVGTQCGGLDELFGSDPGLPELLLAPTADVQGLATRVARILHDPEHATELAHRGLVIARQRFQRGAQVDAYVHMLAQASTEPT